MADPTLLIGFFAACGLFFVGLAVARLCRRRLLAATRSGIGGCLCLSLAALGFALALNLYTYQRLSYEQPVAHLRFVQLGDQHYRALLDTPDAPSRHVELRGDEWQLDARVLKWKPWANLLGFDALYRLERLSGRYTDSAAETERRRTVHALTGEDAGIDAWSLAQGLPRWLRLVDTRYGSAAYLPMADNAEYDIALTQSGLVARRPREKR